MNELFRHFWGNKDLDKSLRIIEAMDGVMVRVNDMQFESKDPTVKSVTLFLQ